MATREEHRARLVADAEEARRRTVEADAELAEFDRQEAQEKARKAFRDQVETLEVLAASAHACPWTIDPKDPSNGALFPTFAAEQAEWLKAAGLIEVREVDLGERHGVQAKIFATELGREKLRAAYALLGLPASPAGGA